MKKIMILAAAIMLSFFGCGKSHDSASSFDPQNYNCPDTCRPPDCMCPKISPPGNISPAMTPQFVLFTIDDAVDAEVFEHLQKPFETKNPNGCPIRATFFVTTDYTDYWLVTRLSRAGHEIAVHTMSHKTNIKTDRARWSAEIMGAKKNLSELALIPEDQIKGFRAPYLQHNPQSFDVIAAGRFLYDSSITEIGNGLSRDESDRIWPYTLDNGTAQICYVGICPSKNYPGLWEIPMYALEGQGGKQIAMDPEGSGDEILELWQKNLLQHSEGNRAPFGLYLHGPWLKNADHMAALTRFLEWASRQNEIWFVTMQELIDYMKNPRPEYQYRDFMTCPAPAAGPEVCDGVDNNGDGQVDEGLVKKCDYPQGNFRTCGACPANYPSLKTVS